MEALKGEKSSSYLLSKNHFSRLGVLQINRKAMALKIGDSAPDFKLPSTLGRSISLSEDYAGLPLILYFYPKDYTRVCTSEACGFRDQFEAFRELQVSVLGISRDNLETHMQFKNEFRLPFELLSDISGQVCKDYDALMPLIKMPKRITYLIDSRHQIAAVFSDMFESKGHIRSMLQSLQKKS